MRFRSPQLVAMFAMAEVAGIVLTSRQHEWPPEVTSQVTEVLSDLWVLFDAEDHDDLEVKLVKNSATVAGVLVEAMRGLCEEKGIPYTTKLKRNPPPEKTTF